MPDQDLLSLRQSATLSSLVAERIEGIILTGKLAAGERINEAVLAREFGVSRGPIREAARLLASHGLVEFVANKGAFVRELSRTEMLEIYDLRALLTGHACQLAALNPDRDLNPLDVILGDMAHAADEDDAAAYYKLNLAFHEALVVQAHSPRLRSMLDSLIKEAHLFRQVSLRRHPDMIQSNIEHENILTAIRVGDGDAARQWGETHVRAGKQRFEDAATPRAGSNG